jgi:hypothetical protein
VSGAGEGPRWKLHWDVTRTHYLDWWCHEGLVLLIAGLPTLDTPRDGAVPPEEPHSLVERYTDPLWFARNQRAILARSLFPADNLPIAHVDYGVVQLAACFGAEPHFAEDTVWYADCCPIPEACPALRLTKTEPWWQRYKAIMLEVLRLSSPQPPAGGDYLVGAPAFGSNLDVLAQLRGAQNLLCDLLDRPGWVHEKLAEINESFFVAFDDYYRHIQLPDGSSAYTFFHLWGPGKTSQVQCDFAAMISPAMFREFVIPPLRQQCAWLDHSLFHLDGPHCIGHLEHLLALEELDAVQWTPGAGQPGAGDPTWYELYTRILQAGKSVQILGASVAEAQRILDTFGPRGVFLSVDVTCADEAEGIIALAESLR